MAARRKSTSAGERAEFGGHCDVTALVALLGDGARRPSDADRVIAKLEARSADDYWRACDEVATLVHRREAVEARAVARGPNREVARLRGRQLTLFDPGVA